MRKHSCASGRTFSISFLHRLAIAICVVGYFTFSGTSWAECQCGFGISYNPWLPVPSFHNVPTANQQACEQLILSAVVADCPYPSCTSRPWTPDNLIATVYPNPLGPAYGYSVEYAVWGSGGTMVGHASCRAQQNLVVKLSRADGTTQDQTNVASVEPTDIFSNASGQNATYLLATVYDQNGQVVPNVGVQLTVDVNANSGGHNHDDELRHTQYMGQLASPQGTVEQNGKVLTGSTGPYGLAFTFSAPAPAGDHTFKAQCTDGRTCTLQGPNTMWVGVKDNGQPLTALPDSPLWIPVGSTGIHSDNHYLTQAALTRLTALAQAYHNMFPVDPVLRLNDASLVRGGVFDIDFVPYTDKYGIYRSRTPGGFPGHWWAPPHAEHRRGSVIDIRANGASDAIPAKYYKRFEDLVNRLGMNYLHEKDHFHVRLLGIAQ